MAAREGAKAARERYDQVSRSPAVKEALEKVQIDHTPVDLIVVDEIDRQPLGRPWLSLAQPTRGPRCQAEAAELHPGVEFVHR